MASTSVGIPCASRKLAKRPTLPVWMVMVRGARFWALRARSKLSLRVNMSPEGLQILSPRGQVIQHSSCYARTARPKVLVRR